MEETDSYTIIKVVRDEDLENQIGKDICFDLVTLDKVKNFRVPKATIIFDFEKKVATAFDIPVLFQRFWLFAWRQNQTYRPSRPLTCKEALGPIGQLKLGEDGKLILFMEVKCGPDLCHVPLLKLEMRDTLLFFKLYDSEKETLRYVGRLFVKSMGKPSDILARLNEMAGFDSDQEIELYEEICFDPIVVCEPVDKKIAFKESQLKNGDIICFQKSPSLDNEKCFSYPDVPSYFEYVNNSELPFSSISQKIGTSKIMVDASVDGKAAVQQSEVDKETTNDENSSKSNNSKFFTLDSEEVDALIEEDVIAVIDKVLSKEINISLGSQNSVVRQEARKLDPNLSQQLLQELRDVAFKEDLVEKFKEGFTLNFSSIKERIEANADAFSSWQLEHVNVIVNLLNKIVNIFDKLENLNKERDTAKKCTEEDNEELKSKRQKILVSKASFTTNQTELKSLDVQIADLKGKLEKLHGDRVKMVEMQDEEKDKITSFNKEVKSIIYRLADDEMKLKSVECNILDAETELESHEKVYKTFRTIPPF